MNRSLVTDYFSGLQDLLCRDLEQADGGGKFREDVWKHDRGGGGRTRIIREGEVFEQGGVNTSAVEGVLTDLIASRLHVPAQPFFAAGLSLVLHPKSPMIPSVHANFRYLELESGDFWFGGGADLTPYYLFREDCAHFHRTWKQVCDAHDAAWYPRFKKACDDYFTLRHRGERRGIGGVFFDYLHGDFKETFAFIRAAGGAFPEAYGPIIRRRRQEPWGEQERTWQLIRRGRYVEFNLLYDRGTLFGLETGGRVESILMSLPPLVQWSYDFKPGSGSREEEMLKVLREPEEWA